MVERVFPAFDRELFLQSALDGYEELESLSGSTLDPKALSGSTSGRGDAKRDLSPGRRVRGDQSDSSARV